jgi:peroxiredoxin
MMNMSKFSRIAAAAAVALASVSCAHVAKIDGVLEQAPSSEVIVKLLDVNKYEVLDTVAVDASGKFSCKVDVQEGQPEFIYLYYGDRKIASLLLSEGDNVTVKADTMGNYTVAGSEESEKLAQVEKDYADVASRMDALAKKLEKVSGDEAAALSKQIYNEYVTYYRSRVRYVMENSKSLTSVPVFYQVLGENLPVFGQITDAIHFSNICDSLETIYPDSKYVKALRKEAQERQSQMELTARLGTAEEIGFPDITLPDTKGNKVRLSDVESKVILVQFWTATEAAQKMFNMDVLMPLYNEYHSKGLEIYQIALDPDKVTWANVVKEQKLPWISVCDGLGANSPYIILYNIGALPSTFIISDGELVDGQVVNENSLRRTVAKLLK